MGMNCILISLIYCFGCFIPGVVVVGLRLSQYS